MSRIEEIEAHAREYVYATGEYMKGIDVFWLIARARRCEKLEKALIRIRDRASIRISDVTYYDDANETYYDDANEALKES